MVLISTIVEQPVQAMAPCWRRIAAGARQLSLNGKLVPTSDVHMVDRRLWGETGPSTSTPPALACYFFRFPSSPLTMWVRLGTPGHQNAGACRGSGRTIQNEQQRIPYRRRWASMSASCHGSSAVFMRQYRCPQTGRVACPQSGFAMVQQRVSKAGRAERLTH